MRVHSDLALVGDKFGDIVALIRAERQPPIRPWRMAVDHIESSPALGMAVGLGQVALYDQTAAVLHECMSHEAQCGSGSGGFFVEATRLCLGSPTCHRSIYLFHELEAYR